MRAVRPLDNANPALDRLELHSPDGVLSRVVKKIVSRMFILADDTDVFVFWLGDGPMETPRAIYKCVINRDALVLYSDPVVSIPTSHIRLVHGGIWRPGVKSLGTYCVTVSTEETSHFLWPINPMWPSPWAAYNYDEGPALRDVITSLWRHQKPEYDKNPYRRQQIAGKKRKVIDLDAEVSPLEYWRQGRLWSKPFLMELADGFWALMGGLAFVVLMALVADWLSG